MRIEQDEYSQRLQKLQILIRENELDLFIVSSKESIFYLTGAGYEPLERPFFLIVRTEGVPQLITPMLDKAHMLKGNNISSSSIISYWEYPSPNGRGWPEKLCEIIGNSKNVGVEPSLTLEIKDKMGAIKTRTLPLIENLRILKTDKEIDMIRRACKYADRAMSLLLNSAYDGAAAIEGFAQTSKMTKATIREIPDYDPVNSDILMAPWAAPRSAQPHSIPAFDDTLGDGPHVALVLSRINGYSSEVERCFFTREPDKWSKAAFLAMIEARRIAFSMIRPKQNCHEIDEKVNKFLNDEGFASEECRLHRTGHGFGLGAHEAPWIAEGSDHVLESNMVISIEPGIYKEGVGGVRHSDTILVTDDGYETLTTSPTEIKELTFLGGGKLMSRLRGKLVRKALNI